jgi:hypothetical protein
MCEHRSRWRGAHGITRAAQWIDSHYSARRFVPTPKQPQAKGLSRPAHASQGKLDIVVVTTEDKKDVVVVH